MLFSHTDVIAVNVPDCDGNTDFRFFWEWLCLVTTIVTAITTAKIVIATNTNRAAAIAAMIPGGRRRELTTTETGSDVPLPVVQ